MELSSMSEKIGDFFMATGDEQLVSFIAKAREKGRTDEQIARSLYSVGWRKERVDAAFMNANEARTGASRPEGEERQALGEEKEEGGLEEGKAPEQPIGRGRLSTPLGGPSSAPPQAGRIAPPARQQQPPRAPPVPPPQQPIYPKEEAQASRLPIQPTIPPAQARAPLDLPHGPDYQAIKDESQVQNPAFQKVQGGMSKLDIEFIARVVIFLVILGAIIGAYLYLTGGSSPIIVSG